MGEQALSLLSTFGPFAVLLIVMYFMLIMPQQRKEKQLKELRSQLEVGDGVVTVGGVVGRVVSVKNDTVVVETGSDRVKIRFKVSAIAECEKLNVAEQA